MKQEKTGRMVEKKHRSQNRSEKWNQSTRKGSREVFSANLISLEEKDLKNYSHFGEFTPSFR